MYFTCCFYMAVHFLTDSDGCCQDIVSFIT
nr:MAG TPA: hypothetical protein [Bacteriophage sp.]